MLRIGQAMDVHRFETGRKLILGGIEIPYEKGLLGHSDADVLLHAITEAILGALGLGDLGEHFPDNDQKYKDIDSSILLKEVIKMMEDREYQIVNIDTNLSLEEPKLKNYKPLIRKNVANIMKIEEERVNVKAGTMEKLGFVGNKEAVIATCVVLLKKRGN